MASTENLNEEEEIVTLLNTINSQFFVIFFRNF